MIPNDQYNMILTIWGHFGPIWTLFSYFTPNLSFCSKSLWPRSTLCFLGKNQFLCENYWRQSVLFALCLCLCICVCPFLCFCPRPRPILCLCLCLCCKSNLNLPFWHLLEAICLAGWKLQGQINCVHNSTGLRLKTTQIQIN